MLKTEIEDQILIATLDGNKTCAMDLSTLEQLQSAVEQVNASDAITGMVITGRQRFFSTGFDLSTFMAFETPAQAGEFLSFADKVFIDLFQCRKPVVCAMNGHAVAGGLILSMAADYRLISNHPKTKVGMSEINIGIPLSAVQTNIMRFGLDSNRIWRDLLYFGTLISGADALQQNIVDELLDPEGLVARGKSIVSAWMNTPGRPFLKLKAELKRDTVALMKQRVAEKERYENLDFFFDKEVQATLAKVQASMA